MSQQKKKMRIETPIIVCGVIAAGLWWFLTSDHSAMTWIAAGVMLGYVCLAYCYIALSLPEPGSGHGHEGDGASHQHDPHHAIEDIDKVMSKFWQL